MTSLEMTKEMVKILDNKKAQDLQVIGIRDLTIIADYFIIASGGSTTQVKALADEVEFQMKEKFGMMPLRTEGYNSSSWILVDYGNVVVHVFTKDTREFYDLERLWADGTKVELEELLSNEGDHSNEV
ncbi:ribosome silencing factor [[Clostridium] leptum]|nr:ribosome silencing factor [[Clostridium] leptum]